MVIVQLLAFGRVQDNRVRRSAKEAAKIERERIRKEKMEKKSEERARNILLNGSLLCLDGICDVPEEHIFDSIAKGSGATANGQPSERKHEMESDESTTEESMTETSEEEMIV